MTPAALADVRVLDLSRILAGPTAGQFLADFGAEVVKVERPVVGDDSRRLGGPVLKDRDGNKTGLSPMFICANRNKKSITIDIAKPAGQELIRKLAVWADVLLENYKAGDLRRYGLDYDSLKALNPRLVYCSVTGFGQTGPYAPRPGYDGVFQSTSGLMSLSGHRDGTPGGGSMRVGVPITDMIGGAFTYGAILTALHYRDKTGQGQHVDMSMLDCAITATCTAAANYLCNGVVPERWGNENKGSVPSGVYRCADGEVQISAPGNDVYPRICKAMGVPHLAQDERFAASEDRLKRRAELTEIFAPLFLKKTRAELIELMEANNVPCAPIYAIDEVFEDPHVRSRGDVVEVEHATVGPIRTVANPMRLSATPVNRFAPPPDLGQHTDSVLSGVLGMDAQAIQALRKDGVV